MAKSGDATSGWHCHPWFPLLPRSPDKSGLGKSTRANSLFLIGMRRGRKLLNAEGEAGNSARDGVSWVAGVWHSPVLLLRGLQPLSLPSRAPPGLRCCLQQAATCPEVLGTAPQQQGPLRLARAHSQGLWPHWGNESQLLGLPEKAAPPSSTGKRSAVEHLQGASDRYHFPIFLGPPPLRISITASFAFLRKMYFVKIDMIIIQCDIK